MLAAVLVLAGGFLGGVARHAISDLLGARFGARFPWGTLAVNVSGAFLAGLLAGLGADLGPLARALLIVGFCGGYTTVSSFALQTLALGRAGQNRSALLNVLASTSLSLAAVAAGYGITA